MFQEATMRIALLTFFVLLLLPAFAIAAVDPKSEPMPTPLMRTVEPYTAKVGMEVVVSGDNLGKHLIAEVFLTADNKNIKVDVLSQSDKELKFKVPDVKPGAYKILVLLRSADPTIIEEPVRLVVEE
jgi:hypothetical protein